jgi:hypothetical protein
MPVKRSAGVTAVIAAMAMIALVSPTGITRSTAQVAAPVTSPPLPTLRCPQPCVTENFEWAGPHAATVTRTNAAGAVTGFDKTVWWNPDRWDVRGSTDFIATSNALGASGFHIDIHQAKVGDPSNGDEVEDGTSNIAGGQPGVAGVGAMRVNFHGVQTARLRNPLVISTAQPGVVSFWATKFVTTGHWFEVSIMPANGSTIDPTLSATPNGTDQSSCPFVNCGGNNTPGPRANSNNLSVPSLNITPMGATENCLTDGYRLRVSATKNENGIPVDIEQKVGGVSDLALLRPPGPVTAAELDTMQHQLVRWRIELKKHPANIVVSADLDNNGSFEYVRTLRGGVPALWNEVYVNLLGVFYNMSGHPEVNGCYPISDADQSARPIREIHWRNFTAGPVKYQTAGVAGKNVGVFPREANGPVQGNAPRLAAMMRSDVRDTQRFDVSNAPGNPTQPNLTLGPVAPDGYTIQQSVLVCTDAAASYTCVNGAPTPAGVSPSVPTRSFAIALPAIGTGTARFLYDIGKPDGAYAEGVATISVNGNPPLVLPNATSIAPSLPGSLIRRYLAIPTQQLVPGNNQIVLSTIGAVRMDNLQIEVLRN